MKASGVNKKTQEKFTQRPQLLDSKKNLGKQLTYANKRQCPVAVICGENEFKDNTVTLKNLLGVKGENNQSTVAKEKLIDEIKKFI